MNGAKPLLEAQNVTVEFPIKSGLLSRKRLAVHAVTDVSLTVMEGETLGLVGESGSGKTTFGRALLKLVPTTSGKILFQDKEITKLRPGRMRSLRQDMQMIFQDPYASLDPRMTVDKIVSALDVSIQAQILNLLEGLQSEFGLTYLFVAHNLSVVRHISDRVAVMYLGHVVELAESVEMYDNPLHPYTQALMSAIPLPDPIEERKKQRIILRGDMPSPVNPPSACPFHTRCFKVQPICSEVAPAFEEKRPGHWAACHFAEVPTITRPEEIKPPIEVEQSMGPTPTPPAS
jgi:oligopeptide/dipeptide ABC transporter ATP-binding protein